MALGENIRKYRKIKGLTQKQLASKAGISENSITRYESGTRSPDFPILDGIADALGCNLIDLIGKNTVQATALKNYKQPEASVTSQYARNPRIWLRENTSQNIATYIGMVSKKEHNIDVKQDDINKIVNEVFLRIFEKVEFDINNLNKNSETSTTTEESDNKD
jgi:transcriptional regulator with XRE-family HTH domain